MGERFPLNDVAGHPICHCGQPRPAHWTTCGGTVCRTTGQTLREAEAADHDYDPADPPSSPRPHRYNGDHDCWAAGCDLAAPVLPSVDVGGKMIEFALDYFLPFIERDFAGREKQDRIDARMRASIALHNELARLGKPEQEEEQT
jgi:hypothetical protein